MQILELDDDLYRELEARARKLNRTPQDLIREAIQAPGHPEVSRPRYSALDRVSTWKGGLIRPWTSRADMLDDFFDRDQSNDRT